MTHFGSNVYGHKHCLYCIWHLLSGEFTVDLDGFPDIKVILIYTYNLCCQYSPHTHPYSASWVRFVLPTSCALPTPIPLPQNLDPDLISLINTFHMFCWVTVGRDKIGGDWAIWNGPSQLYCFFQVPAMPVLRKQTLVHRWMFQNTHSMQQMTWKYS